MIHDPVTTANNLVMRMQVERKCDCFSVVKNDLGFSIFLSILDEKQIN